MNNINTALAVFKFHTHQVRTIIRDGEPWFVASDVCSALGYKNVSQTIGDHLDADERMIALIPRTPIDSIGVETNTISESGLYALVLRSRKPEARKFAKWVTSEVLPSIRKTGKFDIKSATGPLTKEMQQAIKSMVIERAKVLPHEKQAGAIIKAWSALKSHFGVTYKEIPAEKYTEALSLVARMQVQWEVIDESEPAERAPINVRELMLSGLSTPTLPVPANIRDAVERRAIEMALEAFTLSKEFIYRRIAYTCEYGYPQRKLDAEWAQNMVDNATLGHALANLYREELNMCVKYLDRARSCADETLQKLKVEIA